MIQVLILHLTGHMELDHSRLFKNCSIIWRMEQDKKVQGEDCIKEEWKNVYDSQKCNI